MEFNMCLVSVVNLLILFPLIRGNENLNAVAAEQDMVPGETSNVHIHQTIHFPKMDLGKIESIDDMDFGKIQKIDDSAQDESNPWSAINNHHNHHEHHNHHDHHNQNHQWNTWIELFEEKLQPLMNSNQNVVNMLNELGKNLDHKLCSITNNKRDSKEFLRRMNMIQRQIDNQARIKCPEQKVSGVQMEVMNQLMNAVASFNTNLEKYSPKDLNHGDKTNYRKYLEDTSNMVQSNDKRTNEMYEPSNCYYPKILSSSKLNENRQNYFSRGDQNSLKSPARKQSNWNSGEHIMSEEERDKFCKSRINGIHSRMGDEDRVQYEPNKYHCHELEIRHNGIYKFASKDKFANDAGRYFSERYCDFNTDGIAWTVIQRQFLNQNKENFNRSWTDYKNGFGELDKEFWYGNDFIHILTFADDMVLRIVIEDLSGREEWAEYSLFRVDAEKYDYNLQIGGYRGSIPDAFTYYDNQDFTTYDRENDNSDSWKCAMSYGSGWWYNCTEAKLNGFSSNANPKYIGNIWKAMLGSLPVKSSKMMIRPKDIWTGEDSHKDEKTNF